MKGNVVEFGFDPFSLIVAIVALWYAIHESKRNNRVVLRLEQIQCTHTESLRENQGKLFSELRIRIRNLGLTLHSPSLSLCFESPTGHGSFQIPLTKRVDQTGSVDEFSRGMIAEFGCKSYECDASDITSYQLLKDPKIQNACLCVFSQGYLAQTIRVAGFRDRIGAKWNRLTFLFNNLFTRKIGTASEGHDIIRRYTVLPRLVTTEFAITRFIEAVKEKNSADTASSFFRSQVAAQETAGRVTQYPK